MVKPQTQECMIYFKEKYMKYSVIERIGSKVLYVTTKSGNWLDLLNETSKDKNMLQNIILNKKL